MTKHLRQQIQTGPDTAAHVRNIPSNIETPDSERVLNSRDEGAAQIRQTFQSIKNKLLARLGRLGRKSKQQHHFGDDPEGIGVTRDSGKRG
jgi:hypothetical protein